MCLVTKVLKAQGRDLQMTPSMRKASVQGSIIEIRGSQVAKQRYDQIQSMGNALTNKEQADYEIDDG